MEKAKTDTLKLAKLESLSAISNDLFSLKGFATLVEAYENQRGDLSEEAQDQAQFFINHHLFNEVSKIQSVMQTII